MKFLRRRQRGATPARDSHLALIVSSDLFDGAWYLQRNADVARAKLDPAEHFLQHGASEARDPGPEFDVRFYLSSYPDVAASGANPLVHYLLHGEKEGRLRRKAVSVGASLASGDDPFSLPGLFRGSTFEELSIRGSTALMRHLGRSATSAETLARVDAILFSPIISLIVPICDASPRYFREMLQSIFAQTYTNWELCLVDDRSSLPQTIAIFDELATSGDPRIKTRRLNDDCDSPSASQAALAAATGDYVGFLGQDDMLTANALSEIVACLRIDPTVDLVYTDHITVDKEGQATHLACKPTWSPEFFASTDYLADFRAVRRSLVQAVGGLSGDVDMLRDLRLACAVIAAGANVRYEPRAVYLKREQRAPLTFSTAVQPDIESRLTKIYQDYLDRLGVTARQTWPIDFQAARDGIFQLDFVGRMPSVALILRSYEQDDSEEDIRTRFAPVLNPAVTLHVVSLGVTSNSALGTVIRSDVAMLDFVRQLDAEVVVFSTTTGRYLGVDWLTRLASYIMLAQDIGAVGGKVLDKWLQVRSGGMLIDAAGEYRTIAGGCFDNEPAHLNIGRIASNVDAVSSQLIATRRDTLLDMGGMEFHTFGDAAGVAYCARLASRGYRIVYDPHSRQCDMGRLAVPAAAGRKLRELGRSAAPMRKYPYLGLYTA